MDRRRKDRYPRSMFEYKHRASSTVIWYDTDVCRRQRETSEVSERCGDDPRRASRADPDRRLRIGDGTDRERRGRRNKLLMRWRRGVGIHGGGVIDKGYQGLW